jgi:hypothetical protein
MEVPHNKTAKKKLKGGHRVEGQARMLKRRQGTEVKEEIKRREPKSRR